jgi:hypothetical protein
VDAGNWITLAAALVAALSAFFAARSAGKARTAEGEAERLRRLEVRVADRKYDVYKPMLELLSQALDPQAAKAINHNELLATTGEFARWVSVFGSDEAVRAFRNFMQASYTSPPPNVALRLYADFQLAVRRDMGDPQTTVSALDLMGIRIRDIHTNNRSSYDAMVLPFADVCSNEGWQVPWLQAPPALPSTPTVSVET